jgi:phospholipid/cholesterol/gamma-HCH transport system ATP-binding protein
MIQIRNLSKDFDEKPVLRDVDLDIRDGETFVILGPSGQGKTVLIKCLVRLLDPDQGSIRFDDTDVLHLKRRRVQDWRRTVAFVFQENALFDYLNVRDNLSLYLIMNQHDKSADIEKQVLQALEYVGLSEDVLDKFPEELSGGMKKRVAVARALLQKPRYIFFDEPTAGLDNGNSGKVRELIRMIRREYSATIVIVTHDIDLMRDTADRVALLKEGRVEFVGRPEQLDRERIRALYEEIDHVV